MNSKMCRWLAMSMVLFALTVSATACNTMEGMGEDVQAGGRTVERTAEDVKN